MRNRTKAAAVLAALALTLGACGSQSETVQATIQPTAVQTVPLEEESWGRRVQLRGQSWEYNSKLTTLLLMGVEPNPEAAIADAGTNGIAEMIAILVMNPETKTMQMLMIPRETIAQVDVFDDTLTFQRSAQMPISLQYSFGDSASRGSRMMKNKVSAMLYELPIDYYCALDLDGLSGTVELIGGISLTLSQDWTDYDPAYSAGTEVFMDGDATVRFLRHPNGGGNCERLAVFIQQMFSQMGKAQSVGAESLMDSLVSYMESDADAETLKLLATCAFSDDLHVLPGVSTAAGYEVNTEACKDMLLELFYLPEQ